MKFETVLPAVFALLLGLQGCGDGNDNGPSPSPHGHSGTTSSPSGTTFTTPVTTAFTSPAPKSPRAPRPGAEIAELMNEDYHGFNKDDPSSSYGVFIRSTESTDVYCHQTCFSGWADCRVSGSMFNKQVMVTENGTLAWSFGSSVTQSTGYFVNHTEVVNNLGKCAYSLDGGTDMRYNMGCGCLYQGMVSCDDPAAPFWSLDPDTGYTTPLTEKSTLVNSCTFENSGKANPGFYPGPALYRPTGFPKPNKMFEAFQWRLDNLKEQSLWNELVLDGEAMLERLSEDPASVVPAIVYFPDASLDAKAKALKMASDFSKQWNLPSDIPVIRVDLAVKVTDGLGKPFSFETTLDEVQV